MVRFGDYTFDRSRRQLFRGGTAVHLTPKAFTLVEVLVDAYPAAVSKEGLYESLWPALFVEMGNLYTLIAEIRSACGDDSVVRTVHRFGYALGQEVMVDSTTVGHLIVGDRIIDLRSGENVIGRDLLHACEVSRRHACIAITSDGATVADLGSRNGTWINGRRIESPEPLKHGDVLTFGATRATLHFAHEASPVTADLITV